MDTHTDWCKSPDCGEVVAVDANLRTTSHQCAAEVAEAPVPGTNITTPRFCGQFTLGKKAQTCTSQECMLQRVLLDDRLKTGRRELAERHAQARAAAGREGEPDPIPFCYTGRLTKQELLEKRRRLGTMGVFGAAFPGCQTIFGFRWMHNSESFRQLAAFLAEILEWAPAVKHVLSDSWCQTAVSLRNYTQELAAGEAPAALRTLNGALDRGHGPTHSKITCFTDYSADAHAWCFVEEEVKVTTREELAQCQEDPPQNAFLHHAHTEAGSSRHADPVAMVFRQALLDMRAREAAMGEGDDGPMASVKLQEDVTIIDIEQRTWKGSPWQR